MQPITRAAIISYEHDQPLPLTGEATEALLARLVLGTPAPCDDVPVAAGMQTSGRRGVRHYSVVLSGSGSTVTLASVSVLGSVVMTGS